MDSKETRGHSVVRSQETQSAIPSFSEFDDLIYVTPSTIRWASR